MDKIVLALVAACSAAAPTPMTTATKVVSLVDARANLGKRVEIYGEAGNAKLGAIVQTAGRVVVYCKGLSEWPKGVEGTHVTATGTLGQDASVVATTGPDGAVSQGTSEPIWTLANCDYK